MPLIVTNNPQVEEYLENHRLPGHQLCWVEGKTEEVLMRVKMLCHQGRKLITHPLTGSIKPNQTPYKTVVLTDEESCVIDFDSVIMAEECLEKTMNLLKSRPRPAMADQFLDDFALIDLGFFKSYLESIPK